MQKNQIIQTALAVLNRDGLEGVTLRRLATELDVKAASIYWHIANKETLLDEMANFMLEKQFATLDFADDKREWAEWLMTLGHELRAAMLAYREGARVVAGAHPAVTVMLIKLWDMSVRVLHHAGFSYGDAATITVTVINFTFGSVIEEQASPPHAPPAVGHELSADGAFPAMAAAMDAWQNEEPHAHFAKGMRILISGIRAEYTPA